ncbi:hypothetical protein S245_017819 [Arachis hypogaea]
MNNFLLLVQEKEVKIPAPVIEGVACAPAAPTLHPPPVVLHDAMPQESNVLILVTRLFDLLLLHASKLACLLRWNSTQNPLLVLIYSLSDYISNISCFPIPAHLLSTCAQQCNLKLVLPKEITLAPCRLHHIRLWSLSKAVIVQESMPTSYHEVDGSRIFS